MVKLKQNEDVAKRRGRQENKKMQFSIGNISIKYLIFLRTMNSILHRYYDVAV